MSYLLPLGLSALAVGVTYLTCIRPMRRGHGCHGMPGPGGGPAIDAEMKRLREEVQLLQHELDRRTAGASRQEQQSR